MNDVICPGCKNVVSFRNVFGFDEKEIEVLGIAYLFQCLKCKTVFTPPMRFSKRATDKQLKELKKQVDEIVGAKE